MRGERCYIDRRPPFGANPISLDTEIRMAEQKYRVVILGRLAEGADRKRAGAALAKLFDVSPQRVDRLLEGKPVPLRRALAPDDAEKLRERLATLGVPSEVEPVEELSLDLEEASGGESETPAADQEPAVTEIEATAVGGFSGGLERRSEQARAAELDRQGSPGAERKPQEPADEEGEPDGGHEVFVDARMGSAWPGGDSADYPAEDKRGTSPILLAAVAVVVLVLLGGGAYLWLGEEEPPVESVALHSEESSAQPEFVPPPSDAQRRLDELVRSVKVWMIQFGVGYDPTQVTLGRLRSDMGITDAQLEDPWGTQMRYQASPDAFQVLSAGPDRRFGTGDDLAREGKL